MVYLSSNESTQAKKFPINSVQTRFEKVPLSRVPTVKEFQQLQYKSLINMSLCNRRVEFWGFQKPQEHCIYQLRGEGGGMGDVGRMVRCVVRENGEM